MKKTVLVKSIDELKQIAINSVTHDGDTESYYRMPNSYNKKKGNGNTFVPSMQEYSNKVLELDRWDGWEGIAHDKTWTLPMLKKPLNRNGANK